MSVGSPSGAPNTSCPALYKELVVIPSEITPEQYSAFRRLIIDWESSNELIFK